MNTTSRSVGGRRAGALVLTAIAAAAMTGCGGYYDKLNDSTPSGSSSGPAALAPTRLVGVAAVGAALGNATVTVADASATTGDLTTTTGSDGRYSVDVSSLTAPLVVKVSGTLHGETVTHVAVVPSVTPNADNVVNLTPLTSAVAVLVAPAGDLAALADPAKLAAAAVAANVDKATGLVVSTLKTDAGTASMLPAGFNPMSTAFAADGTGVDAVLARVRVEMSGSTVALSNAAAAATETGMPSAVTLTPTTTAAPTLPASLASGDLPTQAEMNALAAKYQACLDLPAAQRFTAVNGTVTSVASACDFTPRDWQSNGRTFAEAMFGERGASLALDLLTKAKVGEPTIQLAMAPERLTAANEIRHPYCNDSACVVMRVPMTTASGRPTSTEWMLGKVNGQWNFVGNQRPLHYGVEARLIRFNYVNAGTPPSEPYFATDRVESVLRLIADPTVGDTSDVRGVRVSGPGLPEGGVFLLRSQGCASADRLAIVRQGGSTLNVTGQNWWWTSATTSNFVLAASRPDGTRLTLPTPTASATSIINQAYAPTPIADPAAAVPRWSRYKFEVFYFSSDSSTPDAIAYARIDTAAEDPSKAVAWPAVAADVLAAHIAPTGVQAAAQRSVTDTLAWTNPSDGGYVSSAWWYGQNVSQATNAQGETATYAARSRLDYVPAVLGDATAPALGFADPRSGTSLSDSTRDRGSNPNPRCGVEGLPPMTASTADYREIGLTFRSVDRNLRQQVYAWRN